jgi:regulation of enolase protein 1 (concanavalin A-like superfamily)
VVVTRDDQSDWSEALRVQILDAGTWRLVRLCFLRMPETVEAGPMTCSPTGEGLETTFSRVAIGEPISRELH